MREHIEVIYENGVLRPLGSLARQFHEHQHLTVTIEPGGMDDIRPRLADEVRRQSLRAASMTNVAQVALLLVCAVLWLALALKTKKAAVQRVFSPAQ